MESQISIILQGPISSKDFHDQIKHNILFTSNNFNILLSSTQDLSTNTTINIIPIVLRTLLDTNGKPNNVLFQILSTQNGLKQCDTPYVVKMRTDHSLSDTRFLAPLQRTTPSPYTFFKEKIRITNFFVRDPLKVPYLFHLSDVILFGRTEDMRLLWGTELPAAESLLQDGKGYFSLFGNEAGITRFREVPEQTVTLRWLERMGFPIHLPHPCATRYSWFKLWENVLTANFELVDARDSGVVFPTHFYHADKRHNTLLTPAAFEEMRAAPGSLLRYARLLFHKYIGVWFSAHYWCVTGWLCLRRIAPGRAEKIKKRVFQSTGCRRPGGQEPGGLPPP
ncbi:MAG: WavE lipopolysaccharide synthesis family protein [Desulfovibrio sp.]|jgi:hypothetical protein|nr:WavE lipopolysaccharide synthesis family protein [Desulfovibrio sp.]